MRDLEVASVWLLCNMIFMFIIIFFFFLKTIYRMPAGRQMVVTSARFYLKKHQKEEEEREENSWRRSGHQSGHCEASDQSGQKKKKHNELIDLHRPPERICTQHYETGPQLWPDDLSK